MNKSKIFAYVGAILLLLIMILAISASMLSEKIIRDQIGDNISYNSISVSRFPYPSIELNDVKLGEHSAIRVKLRISLLSLLSFSYRVEALEVQDVSVFTDSNLMNLEDFHNAAKYLLDKKNNKFEYIQLSNISLYHEKEKIYDINSANLKCINGECELFGIDSDRYRYNFSIRAVLSNNIMQITSSIVSSAIDLKSFEKYDVRSGNFVGNFTSIIKSFENTKISGQLAGNEDVTHFSDMTLESKMLNGKADYAAFKKYGAKLKLDLASLNFNTDDIKNLNPAYLYGMFRPRDFEVHIKNVKIKEDQFKMIDLIGNSEGKKIKISSLEAITHSDDVINVSGESYLSEYGPIFDGRIDCRYNDFSSLLSLIGLGIDEDVKRKDSFSFNSDFYLSPKNFHFSKISSKLLDVSVSGDFGMIFLDSSPRVLSSLDIRDFNLVDNNFILYSRFLGYLKSLVSDMKKDDYHSKFKALKDFPYKASLDINFYDAILGKYKIDNMNANMRLKNSHVDLKKLDIEGDALSLYANGELQSWGIKPIMFINVTSGHVEQFGNSLSEMQDYLIKNIDPKKIQFNASIALDNILSETGVSLSNLRAAINGDDAGGINIKNASVDVFGGRLSSTSYIFPSSLTVDGVYGYNNFLLASIVEHIMEDKSLISGAASASGRFKMNLGDKDFFSKLYINGRYIAKFISLSNFGIDSYIESIVEKEYDAKRRLEYDTYNAIYKGNTDVPLCQGSFEVKNGLLSLKDNNFSSKYTSASINGGFEIPSFLAKNLIVLFEFEDPRMQSSYMMENSIAKQKISLPMKVENNIFSPIRTLDLTELKNKLFRSVKFDSSG